VDGVTFEMRTLEKPEVGRPYFRVGCKFESLNLLLGAEGSKFEFIAMVEAPGIDTTCTEAEWKLLGAAGVLVVQMTKRREENRRFS
jgi:hypothetical protein